MQYSLRISALAVAALAALSFTPASYGWDFCGLFGIGGCSDCCEPCCGCDSSCGCECGCGCEPSCGCGCGCCNGRQFAGQTWNCGCQSGPPICPCTDCNSCGCGVDTSTCGCGGCGCCEASCGCGCGDCCEPTCGCGCGDSCGCGSKYPGCLFGNCCGQLLGLIDRCCCGCGSCGCGGEMYWSEWHNDPPCCHDPCDCYGNWTGCGSCGCGGCGGNGGFCEPYEHAYCPTCNGGYGQSGRFNHGGYYAGRTMNPGNSGAYVARNAAPSTRGSAQGVPSSRVATPSAPAQVARRPVPAYVNRPATSTSSPTHRVSANPNPWRGAQRGTTAQPVATTRPMTTSTTRGQLTRKPEPPVYNTFQR